jgi:serine/threonine protein kinase, bacterial
MTTCTLTDQLLNDRYKIIRPLGAGGMGQTYLAEDTRRPGNPKCVVKQLKPASNDPKFLVTAKRLFDNEAVILEKLGRSNDQIPQLLERFEKDGEFYLILDFVDGEPLSSEMPLGQRWSETQVIKLLQEVLPILIAVHDAGIIHRDIKPDNLIRRQDGKLCLIDFGAVKQIRTYQPAHSQLISLTVAIGTPGYMPTEQSRGKPRPNSDLYALGMVAVQALTGMLPSQLHEDEAGEVIWCDQADVSDRFAMFLEKLTRYHFKERFETATEALQVLNQIVKSQSAQATSNAAPKGKRAYQETVSAEPDFEPASPHSEPTERDDFDGETLKAKATEANFAKSASAPQQNAAKDSDIASKKGQVMMGIGVTIASCLLTGGSWFFWHQNQRQDAITQIKSLAEAEKFDDCLKNAHWSLNNDAEIQSLLASCQLGKARQLATKNDLKGAITIASKVSANVPAYGQVQALIHQWMDIILNQASKLYEQGKFDEAVLTVKSIPQTPFNDERRVQDAIKKWSDERAANDKLLTNARTMLNSGKWQNALDEVGKVRLLGKPASQESDYWNREIAGIVKVANGGIANWHDYNDISQQKAAFKDDKKKIEDQPKPVPTESSEVLSRQDALNLIDKWIKAKSSIFASPFDRNLAEKLTTGKMLEDITKSGGSIDWLQQNNAYYRYGTGRVEATGFFSVAPSQVEIDARVTQGFEFYMNGTLKQSKTDTDTYRFTIVLKNSEWKIANRTEL